ncbi:MAG TPA: hypothetical protein VFE46_01925 [Pirellulales bacterium]|jgi:hypothetical protein|nr:hypothetical protein [Pirellulales bacterium]
MYSQADLIAYLDEALPAETMAAIEDALRSDSRLMTQLTEIIGRRDSGVHSLGEIWRRYRLSCPSREQLGSHLLGILSEQETAYIGFHIEMIGCRCCQANLDDLKMQQASAADRAASDRTSQRRKKYFQSSAGHLRTAKG